MSIKTELSIAVALAIGLLAFSVASASAAGGYDQASFKAEIKGVQTYENEYHHASTGRCDPAIDTSGRERLKFRSIKPVRLDATKLSGLDELVLTSGLKPLRFKTNAKITRSNSHSVGAVPDDCPAFGGGGGEPIPPDCGTKTVTPWVLGVDYYRPGRIELQPEDIAGIGPFENCGGGAFPYLLTGESFGKRQSAELPEDEVFDEKIGKLITIGSGSHLIPDPEGYSETKIRWELSLTRVKGK